MAHLPHPLSLYLLKADSLPSSLTDTLSHICIPCSTYIWKTLTYRHTTFSVWHHQLYISLSLSNTHMHAHTHTCARTQINTHTHTCCEEGEDVSNMKVDNMTSIIYGCHMWWLSSSYLQKSGEKSVTGIWLSYLWGGSWLWHCPLVIVNTCTAMCRLWCRPLSHNFFSQESVACVPLYTLFDFLLRTPF